jgi:hypothetical protein
MYNVVNSKVLGSAPEQELKGNVQKVAGGASSPRDEEDVAYG